MSTQFCVKRKNVTTEGDKRVLCIKKFREFQASATLYMKYALFWDLMQRRIVDSYPRFGTTYRSHL